MSAPRILVAGMGNIFLGDDGFGVEVVQRLAERITPEGVRVADYGIRGFDLAFAMLEEHHAVVLVDALPRGEPPGTVFVLEADTETPDPAAAPDHGQGAFQGHSMTPQAVFTLVRTLGGAPQRVFVVGCEPETFGPENEGRMGLSAPVAAAVPTAVDTVEQLVARLLCEMPTDSHTSTETEEEPDVSTAEPDVRHPVGLDGGGGVHRLPGRQAVPENPRHVSSADAAPVVSGKPRDA